MLTITDAVDRITSTSDFALEGLQTRCLNLSAYADQIHNDVEKLSKKTVQRGSIIVALARLQKKQHITHQSHDNFQLYNLVSRTGLTELTYPKTSQVQKILLKLYQSPKIQEAPFFVATTGLAEVSIVTNNEVAAPIRNAFKKEIPILDLSGLSSLTMQVGIETIDTPRQSYTVIKQLALRNITIVEYITSPTELTIILHDRDLKEAFNALHDKFFSQL